MGITVFALSPPLSRFTYAGPWALRIAATLTVVGITLSALSGLFYKHPSPQYPLGLAVLVLATVALAPRHLFDVFMVSAGALGVNALLIAGLARLLFEKSGGDMIGKLLLIGLVAACLLAASVSAILHLSRRPDGEAAP